MKRYLGIAAAAVMAMSLVGCTLPGEQVQDDDDDFIPSTSYASTDSTDDSIVNYKWLLEPSISAENIIVFDASQVDTDSSSYDDIYEKVAIICQDGLYGFIDYQGNILATPAYKYYYICSCGEVVLYNISDTDDDVREYCTIDDEGKKISYVTEHESSRIKYYYDESSKTTYYAKESENWEIKVYEDKKTVVATPATVAQSGGSYYLANQSSETLYGLVKQNNIVLDFTYEDYYAPAYKGAGLTAIALKKDGKWGYVDSSGNKIIDFNCEEVFSSYNGELADSQDSNHPYLFSEDIVPISINYSFGYYDIEGNCLVRTSEFEQARPVHRGRAWVCQDGLWGVILFGEESDEEDFTTTTTTTTAATTTTKWNTWATTTMASSSTEASTTEPQSSEETTTTTTTTAAHETTTTVATEPVTEPVTTAAPVETEAPATEPQADTAAGE